MYRHLAAVVLECLRYSEDRAIAFRSLVDVRGREHVDALRAQGRISDAKASYERAQTQVQNDSTLKVLISDRLAAVSGQQRSGTGQFTVQLGAFSSFQRAQVQADRYRVRAQAAGMSTPRIVQTTNTQGAKVYAVRVGRFASRSAAETAQKALGSEAKVMTATNE